MAKQKQPFNPRYYMEKSIAVMKQSIQEPRDDKVSPLVGAVLIKPDGTEETAFRGELRHGDHAEFTLLERKNREESLDGSILFATLEPCAPKARKAPKLGCAERIVNARIKKVWIGIEDPDPTVDRKGIKHLQDNGIEVELYDADLQKVIREVNAKFIDGAEERAKKAKEVPAVAVLTEKETAVPEAIMDDLSTEALVDFIKMAKLNTEVNSKEFIRIAAQLGMLALKDEVYRPTGIGLLLFGTRPQFAYVNALIRATYKTAERGEDIETIEGPLIYQADKIQSWYEERIGKQIDRSSAGREVIYDYPLVVFREAIINAIVHRDYDLEGAPIYFEINDDAIIIKSPGAPVKPLSLEQMKRFNAPSLSRNPKIMYVFDQMKLVEQRGLGFQTMKELPEKFGLPMPLVSFEDPYMVFTFPRTGDDLKQVSKNEGIKGLTIDELEGYHWIRSQKEVSTSEYAEKLGYVQRTASRHLSKMLELELIVTNGESRRSPKLKYRSIE